MPTSKLYSDKEIGKIIEQAYKLQQQDEATKGYGLSYEELKSLAAEMGVEESYLRKALQNVAYDEATPTKKQKEPFWGVPLEIAEEVVLKGDVNDEMWENIVDKLRDAYQEYKNRGITEQVGTSRSWRLPVAGGSGDIVTLDVRTKNGQTQIKLKETNYNTQVGIYLGLFMILPLFVFAVFAILGKKFLGFNPAWGLIPTFITTVLSVMITRGVLKRKKDKRTIGQKALQEIATMIEAQSQEATKEVTAKSEKASIEAPKPLLNLDSIPDLPESESNTSMRNRDMA